MTKDFFEAGQNKKATDTLVSPFMKPRVHSRLTGGTVARIQPKLLTNHAYQKPETSTVDTSNTQLPKEVQTKMEIGFGQDFSQVNICQNSGQAELLGARAYAQGTNIYFAPGEYNPTSKEGQELIGHELTHVVQQSHGKVGQGDIQGKGLEVNTDLVLEKEADDMGRRVANERPINIHGKE